MSRYARSKKIKPLSLDWEAAKVAMRDAKAYNYDIILTFSLWQLIVWKVKRMISNIKTKWQTN